MSDTSEPRIVEIIEDNDGDDIEREDIGEGIDFNAAMEGVPSMRSMIRQKEKTAKQEAELSKEERLMELKMRARAKRGEARSKRVGGGSMNLSMNPVQELERIRRTAQGYRKQAGKPKADYSSLTYEEDRFDDQALKEWLLRKLSFTGPAAQQNADQQMQKKTAMKKQTERIVRDLCAMLDS